MQHTDDGSERRVDRRLYVVGEVAKKLNLATPTVYEIARKNPELLGAVRFGRSVRFRSAVIERIVDGVPERLT